jgi:hypothetical protein
MLEMLKKIEIKFFELFEKRKKVSFLSQIDMVNKLERHLQRLRKDEKMNNKKLEESERLEQNKIMQELKSKQREST